MQQYEYRVKIIAYTIGVFWCFVTVFFGTLPLVCWNMIPMVAVALWVIGNYYNRLPMVMNVSSTPQHRGQKYSFVIAQYFFPVFAVLWALKQIIHTNPLWFLVHIPWVTLVDTVLIDIVLVIGGLIVRCMPRPVHEHAQKSWGYTIGAFMLLIGASVVIGMTAPTIWDPRETMLFISSTMVLFFFWRAVFAYPTTVPPSN